MSGPRSASDDSTRYYVKGTYVELKKYRVNIHCTNFLIYPVIVGILTKQNYETVRRQNVISVVVSDKWKCTNFTDFGKTYLYFKYKPASLRDHNVNTVWLKVIFKWLQSRLILGFAHIFYLRFWKFWVVNLHISL